MYLNRDRQLPMATYQEDPAFDALHIRVRDQVNFERERDDKERTERVILPRLVWSLCVCF